MIGDAVAKGRRSSTYEKGPEFKKKNSEGRSYKHVASHKDAKSHGGGAKEVAKIAKRAHSKGTGPGVGVSDRQGPHKQREHKEVKHIDQGQILNEWCSGKRGSYK